MVNVNIFEFKLNSDYFTSKHKQITLRQIWHSTGSLWRSLHLHWTMTHLVYCTGYPQHRRHYANHNVPVGVELGHELHCRWRSYSIVATECLYRWIGHIVAPLHYILPNAKTRTFFIYFHYQHVGLEHTHDNFRDQLHFPYIVPAEVAHHTTRSTGT